MEVNELGEIDYMDTFTEKLEGGGYICVNPEFVPYNDTIINSGRFHVYLVHPSHGTAIFYIYQDDNNMWQGESLPPFVSQELVDWIGLLIERP